MPKDEKDKDKKKTKGTKDKKRKEKGKKEESKNKKSPKAKNYSDRAAKKAEKEKKRKNEKDKKKEEKEIEADTKNVGLETGSTTKKKKKEAKEEKEPKIGGGLARFDGSNKPSSLLRKKSSKKVAGKNINKHSEINGEKGPKDSKLIKQIHDDLEKDQPTASTQLSELIDKLNNAATKLMESKAESKGAKDITSRKSEKLKKVPKVKSPFFNTNAADLDVVKEVPEKNEKRKSQMEKSAKLIEEMVKKEVKDSEPNQEAIPEAAKDENQKSDKRKRKTSPSNNKDDKKSSPSRKGKKKQKKKLDLPPPPPNTLSTTGTFQSSKNVLEKASNREDLSECTQMSVQNDDVIAKKETGFDASVIEDPGIFKKGSKNIKSSRQLRLNKKKKGDKDLKKKKSKRDKKELEEKKEKKSKKEKRKSEVEKSVATEKSANPDELKDKLFDKPQKEPEPLFEPSLAKNKPASDDFVEKIKQLSKLLTSADTIIEECSEATGSNTQPTTPISSSEAQTEDSKVSVMSAVTEAESDTFSTNTQHEVEVEKKLIQKLIKLVREELTDPSQLDSREDDNEWIPDQPLDDQPIQQSDEETKESSVFNEISTTEGTGTSESESMMTTETNTEETTSTAIGKTRMPVDSIMKILAQRNQKKQMKQTSKVERKATRMIKDIFVENAREEAIRAKMDQDRVKHGKLAKQINKLEKLQKEFGINRYNKEFKRIPPTRLVEPDTSNDVILGRRSNRATAYSNVMFELISQNRDKLHSQEWKESLVILQTSISLRYQMSYVQESNIVRILFKDFNLTNKNCLQLLSKIENLRIISPRDTESLYTELWLILSIERFEITANKFSQILKPYLKQGTLAFSFKRQY